MLLRYPRTLTSIVLGASTVCAIGVGLGLAEGAASKDPGVLMIYAAIAAGVLLPSWLEFGRYWLRYGDEGLESQGMFYRRNLRLSEITRVRFSQFANLVFEGPGGAIRVNPLVGGFDEFVRWIEPRLPAGTKGTAFQDLDRYRENVNRNRD